MPSKSFWNTGDGYVRTLNPPPMNQLTENARRLLSETLNYMRTHGTCRGHFIDSPLSIQQVLIKGTVTPPACLLGAQVIVAHRADWLDYSYHYGDDPSGQPLFIETAKALIAAGAVIDEQPYRWQRRPFFTVAKWFDDTDDDQVFALIEKALA